MYRILILICMNLHSPIEKAKQEDTICTTNERKSENINEEPFLKKQKTENSLNRIESIISHLSEEKSINTTLFESKGQSPDKIMPLKIEEKEQSPDTIMPLETEEKEQSPDTIMPLETEEKEQSPDPIMPLETEEKELLELISNYKTDIVENNYNKIRKYIKDPFYNGTEIFVNDIFFFFETAFSVDINSEKLNLTLEQKLKILQETKSPKKKDLIYTNLICDGFLDKNLYSEYSKNENTTSKIIFFIKLYNEKTQKITDSIIETEPIQACSFFTEGVNSLHICSKNLNSFMQNVCMEVLRYLKLIQTSCLLPILHLRKDFLDDIGYFIIDSVTLLRSLFYLRKNIYRNLQYIAKVFCEINDLE